MFKSPVAAQLPPFSMLYADISYATHRQISRHLGLSEATVAKYLRTENAPRSVMLAMFWESHWGMAWAHTDAYNFGKIHSEYAQALKATNERLMAHIALLEHELASKDAGAANSPVFNPGRALTPRR